MSGDPTTNDLIAAMDRAWLASIDRPPTEAIYVSDVPGARVSGRWRGRKFSYRKPSDYELFKRFATKDAA